MNYHLMELVVYGYDHREAPIYTELVHVEPINSVAPREFSSLRDVVRVSADAELIGAFEVIERTCSPGAAGTTASGAPTCRA